MKDAKRLATTAAIAAAVLFCLQGTAHANMGFGKGFGEILLVFAVIFFTALNLAVELALGALIVVAIKARPLNLLSLALMNLVSFPIFSVVALYFFSLWGSSTLIFQLALLPIEAAVVAVETAGVHLMGKPFKTGITIRQSLLLCLACNVGTYVVGIFLSALLVKA